MISFSKKPDAPPAPKVAKDRVLDEMPTAAAVEKTRKARSDGTVRRDRQKAEDNRLL